MQLEQQQAALSRWKQGLESSLQERKQPLPRKAQVQYMLGRLHHVSGQLFRAAAKMYGLQPACERLCSALGWELICVVGAGAAKGVKAKKGGEAWMLNQSNKDPAKVTAAKQALKGKLSKPMPKKTAQVPFVDSNVIRTMPVAARTPSVLLTGPRGVSGQYMP